MPVLLALILILCPRPAGSETLHVGLTMAAELRGSAPEIGALQSGVGALFAREYGRFADISFDAAPGAGAAGTPGAAPGAGAAGASGAAPPAPAAGSTARVILSRQAGRIDVSTDLARGGVTRSLSSSVPAGALASLVSTITGDVAFLFFSAQDFSAFPLAAPPSLRATLQTETLRILTGWDSTDLEPIALAESEGQVTICFPHRYLTLDPLFRITADTIRDLNAQTGSAGEPLQLSGIAAGRRDELLLLSEREGVIARINPLLGTRQQVSAPGLSGVGGRMLDPDTLAELSNAGGATHVVLHGASPSGRRTLSVPASYASALSVDPEGNLWVWDAGERRVRVMTAGGREVFSIRPMISASLMQLPQQLEVFEDGSFLLGGSAEVWKFDNAGIPAWRLSRIPGRPGEKLPPSFALVAHGADGSFTLLDAPSRRLMTFGPVTGRDDELTSLLARLDGRRRQDLQNAGELARRAGLSLMAWQFGDLLARRGGSENDREAARREVLREKCVLYAALADSMARAQLIQRADGAYLRAAEAARELTAAAPDDDAAARLGEAMVSKRQAARAGLTRASDVRIVSAAAGVAHEGGCALSLTVMLRVRNNAASNLTRLRVHLGLPSITETQALAAVDTLFPGDERDMEFPLRLDGPLPPAALEPGGIPAVLLITYERGEEGFSVPDALTVRVMDVAAGEPLANSLACRAETGDQLVAGLADDLLAAAGPVRGAADPVASLAGILDSLGGLRRQAASGRAGVDQAAQPDPGRAEGGVRRALRALSPDETDWTLLSLSVIAGLGLPAGLISWPDRVCALVDTGIPLSGVISSVPGIERYSGVLRALSREERLCVPLSGRLSPDASSAAAWSVVDALEICRDKAVRNASIAWLDTAVTRQGPALPCRSPFPLFLPACRCGHPARLCAQRSSRPWSNRNEHLHTVWGQVRRARDFPQVRRFRGEEPRSFPIRRCRHRHRQGRALAPAGGAPSPGSARTRRHPVDRLRVDAGLHRAFGRHSHSLGKAGHRLRLPRAPRLLR